MGSIEYLLAVEEQLRKQSDAAYNEQLRTYPRTVEHMMRDESGECAFNLAKIIEQEEHNQKTPTHHNRYSNRRFSTYQQHH